MMRGMKSLRSRRSQMPTGINKGNYILDSTTPLRPKFRATGRCFALAKSRAARMFANMLSLLLLCLALLPSAGVASNSGVLKGSKNISLVFYSALFRSYPSEQEACRVRKVEFISVGNKSTQPNRQSVRSRDVIDVEDGLYFALIPRCLRVGQQQRSGYAAQVHGCLGMYLHNLFQRISGEFRNFYLSKNCGSYCRRGAAVFYRNVNAGTESVIVENKRAACLQAGYRNPRSMRPSEIVISKLCLRLRSLCCGFGCISGLSGDRQGLLHISRLSVASRLGVAGERHGRAPQSIGEPSENPCNDYKQHSEQCGQPSKSHYPSIGIRFFYLGVSILFGFFGSLGGYIALDHKRRVLGSALVLCSLGNCAFALWLWCVL